MDVDPAQTGSTATSLLIAAAKQSANAMFIADRDGRIRWGNAAFVGLYGYEPEEFIGQTPRLLKSGRQSTLFYQQLWSAITQGQIWRGTLINRKKSGELFDVEQTITPLKDEAGRVQYFFVVYEDVTQQLRAERRLTRMALFDSVSGLPNRNQLMQQLNEAMARSMRSGATLALMLIDLDYFKNVNDSLGHMAGDELLAEVGMRLSLSLRDGDFVARLGGDEFAIVTENVARPEQSVEAAQRVLSLMRMPFQISGRPVSIGCSVGIAMSGGSAQQESSVESLLQHADYAMYKAKAQGRDCFVFFDAEMGAAARRRHALESELENALINDRLQLVYQPQFSTDAERRLLGAEALLRWETLDGEAVAPEELVAIAEKCGLIFAVNEWVLKHAIRQAAQWRQRGLGDLYVAINVSAGQFDCLGLDDMVDNLLRECQLEASHIHLEITETVVLRFTPMVMQNLRGLAQLGVRLVIDDFGTGYASLNSLRGLPIGVVKLDKSYIAAIGISRQDEQLIVAVRDIANALGLTTIAEGIETPEQLSFLDQAGIRAGQGYLLGRPMPVAEFERLAVPAFAALS